MSSYGLVISIAGCRWALTSHAGLTSSWAGSNTRQVIKEVPPAQTVGIDPDVGESSFDAGGLTVRCTDLSFLATAHMRSGVTTTPHGLTAWQTFTAAKVAPSDTSIDLEDASGLTAPGTGWFGREMFTFSGISTNTLTGVTRGVNGSLAQQIPVSAGVYNYMPTLSRRRAMLEWVDLRRPTVRRQRFVGMVQRLEAGDGGDALTFTSLLKLTAAAKVCAAPFVKGSLLEPLTASGLTLDFHLVTDDKALPWTDHNAADWNRGEALIDDEVVRFTQAVHPAANKSISVVSGSTCEVPDSVSLDVGDLVDFYDPGGGTYVLTDVRVVRLVVGASTVTVHTNNTLAGTVTTSHELHTNYKTLIPGASVTRGAAGTTRAAHDAGAAADEIRVLEGDQIDLLYWLLFSVDGGLSNGPGSGKYDVLPPGWGLGLDSTWVDTAALDDLRNTRSAWRRYRWTAEQSLDDLLGIWSVAMNALLMWREDGVFTGRARGDLYPGVTLPAINTGNLHGAVVPASQMDNDHMVNMWTVQTDWDVQGTRYAHTLTLDDPESRLLRGDMPLGDVQDPGLLLSAAAAQLYTSGVAYLLLRSDEVLILRVELLLDPAQTWRPGDLVTCTIPHVLNLSGSRGIVAEQFEVLEVSPNDPSATVSLVLMQRRQDRRVGRIGFAGVVESVGGSVITLRAGSWSKYTNQVAAPLVVPSGETGLDDVHWFLVDDAVTVWDVSSFGSTVASHDTTVANINYATRQVTLASTPGSWTIAAGDLLRLDGYTTVLVSPTVGDRKDIYLAIADSSFTPPALGSDPAYQWGI